MWIKGEPQAANPGSRKISSKFDVDFFLRRVLSSSSMFRADPTSEENGLSPVGHTR